MLNSSIILSGQQFDLAGAMQNGLNMAASQKQFDTQNALAELYKTQGAGMVAGDPGAINALAQFDPQAAMGIKQTHHQMAKLDADTQRQVEEYARTISTEQAAAEAAEIEQSVKRALMAPDAATFDAMVTQMGSPELVGQFDNRQSIAADYMSMAEVLKTFTPEEPADEYGRYVSEETAAGREPLSRIDYSQAIKGNGITQTITNPDGTTTTMQIGGKPSGGGAPTEGSLASEGYLQRMKGAEAIFTELEKGGTTAIGLISKQATDSDAEGYVLSGPEQQLLQAQRDWVRAKLRKESGAVIGPDEMAAEIRLYFPQPGEGAEVIAQKKASRKRAEEQLRISGKLPPEADAPAGDDMSDDDLLKLYGGE